MKRMFIRAVALILALVLLGSFGWAAELPVPAAYEKMFPAAETRDEAPMAISNLSGTALAGKSILFVGDSLTTGYGLDDFRQSWSGLLGTKCGMWVTSCSVAASTVATSAVSGYQPGGSYSPICQRSLPQGNYDIVFVAAGGNDWYCQIPIGYDVGSRDTDTFMGALNVTIDRLQEAYPDALLLFSTSWNSTGQDNGVGLTTEDYSRAMLEVCSLRDVPCFEACDPNLSGIDSANANFRKRYFLTQDDYWHLNPAGHALYLPVILEWLEETYLAQRSVSGFFDVLPGDWFAQAVTYAVENGITNGTSEHYFSPYMTMNRGMMVTLLYRAAGSPDVSELGNPFPDIKGSDYYYSAVIWAHDRGITQGVGDGTFAPGRQLTRQELAVFLYRFSGVDGSGLPERLHYFPDETQVQSFAREAMNWMVYSDILHGNGAGELAPLAVADRCQTVQLLMNYFESDIW